MSPRRALVPCLCAIAFAAAAAAQEKSATPVTPAGQARGQAATGVTLLASPGPRPHWVLLAPTDPEASGLIERGIDWLRRQQEEDGHWTATGRAKLEATGSAVVDVGITGLCLWALAREGRPDAKDPDAKAIATAVDWLCARQQPPKGADPGGCIGLPTSQEYVYGHAIATIALAAASRVIDSERVKTALGNALTYVDYHRNTYGVWRYLPRDNDGDTSVSVWCMLALTAGAETGLTMPEAPQKAMAVWLDSVTDPATGSAGYQKRGEGSSRTIQAIEKFPKSRGETLTAAALLCRQALGHQERDVPTMPKARDLVLAKAPVWEPAKGDVDYIGWYFGSEAMRGADTKARKAWRDALVAAATKGQQRGGAADGSWPPVDPWSEIGGRTYATAMMVLALQTLYAPAAAPAPRAPAAK
jgi:hypothetical protein